MEGKYETKEANVDEQGNGNGDDEEGGVTRIALQKEKLFPRLKKSVSYRESSYPFTLNEGSSSSIPLIKKPLHEVQQYLLSYVERLLATGNTTVRYRAARSLAECLNDPDILESVNSRYQSFKMKNFLGKDKWKFVSEVSYFVSLSCVDPYLVIPLSCSVLEKIYPLKYTYLIL
jgi:hypothetical protein